MLILNTGNKEHIQIPHIQKPPEGGFVSTYGEEASIKLPLTTGAIVQQTPKLYTFEGSAIKEDDQVNRGAKELRNRDKPNHYADPENKGLYLQAINTHNIHPRKAP